jgi:ribonuclease P protein component
MRKNSLRSLAKRRDFELVFKEGLSAAAKYLVLYARPNEMSWNRLGLSVSKKIGKAVIRNRVKRLLRESVRKVLGDSSQHYDVVIVVRKAAAEAKLENFIREIEKFSPKISHEKCSDSSHKTL